MSSAVRSFVLVAALTGCTATTANEQDLGSAEPQGGKADSVAPIRCTVEAGDEGEKRTLEATVTAAGTVFEGELAGSHYRVTLDPESGIAEVGIGYTDARGAAGFAQGSLERSLRFEAIDDWAGDTGASIECARTDASTQPLVAPTITCTRRYVEGGSESERNVVTYAVAQPRGGSEWAELESEDAEGFEYDNFSLHVPSGTLLVEPERESHFRVAASGNTSRVPLVLRNSDDVDTYGETSCVSE